jgi:Delta3-Delta2-enoyl-CoA isomerase
MTTGRRFGGIDAQTAGLVDEAVPEAEVLTKALARAGGLVGKNPQTLAAIKNQMYVGPLAALREG